MSGIDGKVRKNATNFVMKCDSEPELLMARSSTEPQVNERKLSKSLGVELRDYIKREQLRKKLSSKELRGILSKKLRDDFGVVNSELTVTRTLQRIRAAEVPFSEEYRQCLESVFQAPLPISIRNFLQGKPPIPTIWNPSNLTEELKHFSPNQFVEKLLADDQKNAAKEEYARHLDVLRKIEQGQIPLRLDTAAYFNRFFDFVNAGTETKRVRVFARLFNLEARKNLLKFGPKGLQDRFVQAVRAGQLDAEYIIFLRGPESLRLSEVKQILKFYSSFASKIYLHYLTKTALNSCETAQTIAIWDESGIIFTHDWDYRGNIENLIQWIFKEDHDRLCRVYSTIKTASDFYYARPGPN